MSYSILSLHKVCDAKNLTAIVYTDQVILACSIIERHQLIFSHKIIFEKIDQAKDFGWMKSAPVYNIKKIYYYNFSKNIKRMHFLLIVICFMSMILNKFFS